MSAFSAENFNATGYDRFRPSYPDEFYQSLQSYHNGNHNLLVDVGCGPGTATFQLSEHLQFKRIVGTDLSTTMINKAQDRLSTASKNFANVSFRVSPGGEFSFFDQGSADMVTAAQCVHWFDFHHFQNEVWKVLAQHGTLAIWGYVDPIFLDYPELDAALLRLQYGDEQLGPYWEQPGRSILRNLFDAFVIDEQKFEDIVEVRYTAQDVRSGRSFSSSPLKVCKVMNLQDFKNYIGTWSSYHNWKDKNPDKPDIRDHFFHEIFSSTKLSWQTEIRVVWNTVYKLARKR